MSVGLHKINSADYIHRCQACGSDFYHGYDLETGLMLKMCIECMTKLRLVLETFYEIDPKLRIKVKKYRKKKEETS